MCWEATSYLAVTTGELQDIAQGTRKNQDQWKVSAPAAGRARHVSGLTSVVTGVSPKPHRNGETRQHQRQPLCMRWSSVRMIGLFF